MANVGSAYVTIAPTMSGFSKNVSSLLNGQSSSLGSSAGSTFSNSFQNSGQSRIGAAMGAVAGVASSVAAKAFNAIAQSMGAAVARVDQLNNFPKVMENLGYSSTDASNSIQKMSSAIDGLPTSLDTLSGMTQQLAPLCSNLDEATDISIALNDAMLAGGKSSEDVSRAMTQYTQALSKGKPDLMDWRTLQEVMPGQLNQIAQAMLGAGKNSNDLYEELKNGTVSMQDFNQAVLQLDKEGLNGFASFSEQAKDATQGIGTAVSNVGNRLAKAGATLINAFGAKRISGAINAISSSFGTIADKLAPAFAAAGQACETFFVGIQTRMANGEGFISAFASSVRATLAQLFNFDPNLSFFENIKNAVAGVMAKFSEMSTPAKIAVSVITALFAKQIGGGLITSFIKISASISGVVSTVSRVVSLFAAVGSTAASLGGGISGLARMFSLLTLPISPIAIAIGALVAAFAALMATNDEFRNSIMASVSTIVAAVQPAIEAIGSAIMTVINAVMPVITQTIQTIAPLIAQVVAAIAPIIATIISLISQIIALLLPVLIPVIQTICNIIQTILPPILTVVTTILNGIMAVINAVMPVIQTVITTVLTVIQNIVNVILAVISGDWESAWQGICNIATTIWDGICSIIDSVINTISSIISSVLGTIQGVWDSIWGGISSGIAAIWDGICSGVQGGIDAVYKAVTSVKDSICGFFAGAGQWLIDSGKAILQGLGDGIMAAVNGVVDTVSGAVGWIRDLFPFSPAKTGPFSGHGWVIYSGMSIMDALAAGVEKRASATAQTIKGAMAAAQAATADDTSIRLSTEQSLIARVSGNAPDYITRQATNNYYTVNSLDYLPDSEVATAVETLFAALANTRKMVGRTVIA